MHRPTTSILILGMTLVSIILLLGLLSSASTDLSKMGTTTTPVISTSSSSPTSSSNTGLHELTFIQRETYVPLIRELNSYYGIFPSGYYWLPWNVTISSGALGTVTESNPPNTIPSLNIASCNLPPPGVSCSNVVGYSGNDSLSTITFLVPYGNYSYKAETAVGVASGQVDFSPSSPAPVGVDPPCWPYTC